MKSTIDWIALILVIVGGLNWGLEAINFNLVETIFGIDSLITNVVYALVGISAIWMIVYATKSK